MVILILGILAGVAAPKFLDTSKKAKENGLRQTLSIVRDAIELYMADQGSLPPCTSPGTNFHTALKPYIRGTFPTSPFGNLNNEVTAVSSPSPPVATAATTGWIFNTSTGEFICNDATVSSDGSTKYEEF